MKFELFYPQWKDRAVTFSYDDGQIFDRRLVDIFNKYNLKATFHLNSGTLDTEGFIKTQELKSLYQGHEIACHGVAHEYPTHLSQERLVQEFYQDRCSLERETGRIIRGCSYAFGEYDENVISTLKSLGFVYSRTVESTGGFRIPKDFMRWTPSCHHNDAFKDMAECFWILRNIRRSRSYMYGDIALNLTVNRHGRKWKNSAKRFPDTKTCGIPQI